MYVSMYLFIYEIVMIMFASIASTMTVTESEFARVMLSVYVRVCVFVCIYV